MKNNLILVFCLTLLFVSCKKSGDDTKPTPIPAGHLQLPHGGPIENIISKEIGPAGGSLQSEDGVMQVTVPAGTVDAPTIFSIQQVENTLESRGRSYRLKPGQAVFT